MPEEDRDAFRRNLLPHREILAAWRAGSADDGEPGGTASAKRVVPRE